MALRASGGDFAASPVACLGNDSAATSLTDALQPGLGQALYYVVRATNCAAETGSYDTQGIGQAESRDHELQVPAGACACDAENDLDNDAFCDAYDNCPSVYNPNQFDIDHDGLGGACDECTDTDGDQYGNPEFPSNLCPDDNCPFIPNDQIDIDADGQGDACDLCPQDRFNDSDGDGVCANSDNCPTIANATQIDGDNDGVGDACDPCTSDVENDSDGDGICADVDNCADVANASQIDSDGDGIGDACDTCTDLDGDGFGNPEFTATVCTIDNCPDTSNPDQEDWDFDGVGNVCDVCPNDFENDGDADGLCAGIDNCPEANNPNQEDIDGDAIGNACDPCTDTDGDGFGDPGFAARTCGLDNCPALPNADQTDADSDNVGDSCDVCPVRQPERW